MRKISVTIFSLILGAFALASCGEDTSPPVSVSVSPATVTLNVDFTQQFNATVTNASNSTVTWQVDGVAGGNATVGTIDTSGLYTPPSSVPSPNTVTVSAVSNEDGTKSASATVTLLPPVTVTVSPNAPSVVTLGTQQFTATVANTSDTSVTWDVNGTAGGNSTVGTIDSAGLYTAPASVPNPATVTVTAVSNFDNAKSDSAAVTVFPPVEVTVSPTIISVVTNATQQFTATVANAADISVTWQVNGVTGGNATVGTIDALGLYTAPAMVPDPETVTVTALSNEDNTKSASATVPITAAAITVSITPNTPTVAAGATQQFTATVANASDTSVTWEVDGIVGGNATLGTIDTAGLYTAPVVPPMGQTVTVEAISVFDPTKSDAATVTDTYSDESLMEQYAIRFSLESTDSASLGIGSLTADGAGTVTGAVDLIGASEAGLFNMPNVSVTGTYSIAVDGRGDMTISGTGIGPFSFRVEVVNFDLVRLAIATDDVNGAGNLFRQTPADFSQAAITGNYVLDFDFGTDEADANILAAGIISADGAGGIPDGTLEENLGSGLVTRSLDPSTYDSVDSNGRTLFHLVLPSGGGTLDMVGYVISGEEVLLQSSPADLNFRPIYRGRALQQEAASYSNASLSGIYVFNDDAEEGFRYRVGVFVADGAGAITSGTFDHIGFMGTTNLVSLTGTYSVDALGRGTAAFTSSLGTDNFVFYHISPSKLLILASDSGILSRGEADLQSGAPFTLGSLTGNYALQLRGFDNVLDDQIDLIGHFDADGAGNLSGVMDSFNPDNVNDLDLALTGTNTVTAGVTPAGSSFDLSFTLDAEPSLDFRIYMISPDRGRIFGLNAASDQVIDLRRRY